MPVYEYTCKDCGLRFEVIRSMKDADAPLPCQKCGGDQTFRNISLFNARSGGQSITHSSSSCGGCTGGSCASCRH